MKLNERQMAYLENALYDHFSNGEQILISPVEVLSIVDWGHNKPDDSPCESGVIYKVYCGYDGPKNEDRRGSIEFVASIHENTLEDLLLGWGNEVCWPTKPEYAESSKFGWLLADKKRSLSPAEYAKFLWELRSNKTPL
jgi:hypothetical protein